MLMLLCFFGSLFKGVKPWTESCCLDVCKSGTPTKDPNRKLRWDIPTLYCFCKKGLRDVPALSYVQVLLGVPNKIQASNVRKAEGESSQVVLAAGASGHLIAF